MKAAIQRPTVAISVLTALLLAPRPCDACSCAWAGSFLTVAPGAAAIVRARVTAYHGRSRDIDLAMDVDVVEVMKGVVGSKRIRIWGDNGAQCRPYVSGFPVGTEWLFAIDQLKQIGKPGDYFINGCGEYWAKVEGSTAVGRLTSPNPPAVSDVPERMSLDELRSRLRQR